ncbi:MAG: transcription antitermination factor NusB [Candidatus Omnitrophica bacterium]|jgi:N utilization substance protein B|nr:transcription antitermination factor NusB [Candidatus Omnitrophota bacterium]
MRKRSRAREYALQMLYQLDITSDTQENVFNNFWLDKEHEDVSQELKDFSAELLYGVSQHIAEIDAKIRQYADNWQLERMAFVDRNIMRMGSFELLFREDIPPKVSINEAVELAKKYSGAEAGKFVNAILDKINIEKRK